MAHRSTRPHTPARTPAARRRRLTVTIAAGTAASALFAGCAGADETAPAGSSGSAGSAAGAEPVTVDNCGFEVTVDSPPERVVTIKSTSTEMMLALGLGDRLVGTAFSDGPVPERYADQLDGVPVLSDKVPGQEALLDVEPDFVYGGWESNFAVDTAGERDALADFGIDTYVSPAACKDPQYQPDPMTFEKLFDQMHEIARIFGVTGRADELVAEQRSMLDSVDAPGDGLTAMWYSSGSDAPYVGAGIGAPAMMMDALGLRNVFGDIDDTWSTVGWEDVVDRNPDVIVLVDAAWNTAEHKIDQLESNPATSALPAVTEQRYIRLPFPAAEAGVRNAPAVVDLAEQLRRLDLGAESTG
ncbi:iron complex transport system substrate-binding protein [Haloactinopolyspora alba]|uniref:Iron complex transport system substrate-binding protein n=1 Tax=Haloactinopolyspora alba TaxID=648780 RepID=A0A2P8E1H8_9ACTN|nr:putative F420-0 ABC transporter substrate-binding protein [Haloactinopolyspora alba]PSL03257.1 iron complex transport system substrate-binding protein [Haloactinopolyspora alba]